MGNKSFAEKVWSIIWNYTDEQPGKYDQQVVQIKKAAAEITKLVEKIAGEYINEREGEVFLSGEMDDNRKIVRKGYWTGLAEGAKELLRRLKEGV